MKQGIIRDHNIFYPWYRCLFLRCWQERSPQRSAQLWSDIRIQCNISLFGSLVLLFLPFPLLLTLPPPTSVHSAWLQLKGKKGSGEVHFLHREVPGRPCDTDLPASSFCCSSPLHAFFFSRQRVSLSLSTLVTSSRETDKINLWWANSFSIKQGSVQKLSLVVE